MGKVWFEKAVVVLMLAVSPAVAEDKLVITFGSDAASLHLPVGSHSVALEPAFEDYAYMMFDICDAMGLAVEPGECLIYPMNGDIGGNAIAAELDGNQIIVYDRELSPLIGHHGALMVMAHEVGHHYCGHIQMAPDPTNELAADAFAGAAMRLMGLGLDAALSAVPIFSSRPSVTHPERRARIAAITRGWDDPDWGRSCAAS